MTTESPPESTYGKITDAELARMRGLIGVPRLFHDVYFNTEATADTIRHFVNGIGDPNPLYRDDNYAAGTRWGKMLAPPQFLYSVWWSAGAAGRGFPGVHGFHSGNDWKFYLPIRAGDRFTYDEVLTDVIEKESQYGGRSVILKGVANYRNQTGALVATGIGWTVRAERHAGRDRKKYSEIGRATYTSEELDKIYAGIEAEEVRGSEPRYWEDVVVGQELQPVIKGPLTLRDIFAWLIGAGTPYVKAHRFALEYTRRHPGVGMLDSTTGQVDVPELVHMEDTRAQEIGIPGAYDYGAQRMSWLFHVLTNWVGDDGFIEQVYGELRRFNVVGDTTWIKGRVTGKRVEGERYLVDVECWGENQRAEITMPGRATVALPSRTGWLPVADQ